MYEISFLWFANKSNETDKQACKNEKKSTIHKLIVAHVYNNYYEKINIQRRKLTSL